MDDTLSVVKVGGSLLDLPDLRARLQSWLASRSGRTLLVSGGGPMADAVRQLHFVHGLAQQTSHWLAIRTMTLHAHFLSGLLQVPVVTGESANRVSCLDAFAFLEQDEGEPGSLEHSWRVTSDAIAARVATKLGGRVVLMKSVDRPADLDWFGCASQGLIDPTFPVVVQQSGLDVEWVNLRATPTP